MRSTAAVLAFIMMAVMAWASPAMAQANIPLCPNVDLLTPADGAVLDTSYRTNFTWSSEPRGTASREWVSVRVDGDATSASFSFEDARKVKAEPRSHKEFARGRPGIYAWTVIFYDANGNPICQSEARTYVILGAGFASLSDQSSAAAIAAAKAALGRYIIVLTGNGSEGAYGGTGTPDRFYASNNYDDTTADNDGWQAKGYTGLEIWGNKNNNKIVGSNLSDVIYGGDESCIDWKCKAGDDINGRDGNDEIYGGNEQCVGLSCVAGDKIRGGNGKDTIYGGNEQCLAGSCLAGDNISGDAGEDTLYGGNEQCTAILCVAGDTISGGTENDNIKGGNEQCVGLCSAGDTITGNAGSDTMMGEGGRDRIDGNLEPVNMPVGTVVVQ